LSQPAQRYESEGVVTATAVQDHPSPIASSNEYRTDLVQGYYEHFLNRAADSAGVSSWVAAMGSGWTDEQVISGIVGSAEFYTDSTT